jgi:FlaA1/EpsC-like NDP-sugar epimerase
MVYLIPAVGIAMILSLIVNSYFGVFPLGLIIFASGLAFLGFVFVRYRSRLFTGLAGRLLQRRSVPAISRERVLIIGGGDAGQLVAWMLENHRDSGAFHVIGFADDDLYMQGVRIRGAEVLGRREDIPRLVEEMDVGILVFAIHNIKLEEQRELLRICGQTSARLLLLPDFLGKLNAIISMEEDDVTYPPSSGEAFSPTFWDNWLKHIEDSVRSGKVATSLAEIEAMRTRVQTWGQEQSGDWEVK